MHHQTDWLQVQYVLPYWLLTAEDLRNIYNQLLDAENYHRRHSRSENLMDKLPLKWDNYFLEHLVSNQDFDGGFAKDGGSRCLDDVKQLTGRLATYSCPEETTAISLTAKDGKETWECIGMLWAEL